MFQSQAPTWSDMPRTYGLTGPISEDLPEEENLIQTRKLLDTMKSYNVYENNLELEHRERVVKRLESLFRDWLKEMCIEMNVPKVVTEKVGGKIFPFGSYHLGVHSKGADIDALCVGPGFLERKAFFTSFFAKLKAQKEVKDIQAIEKAYVPVITLSWEGIQIDLVFALLPQRSVPDNLDLLNNSIVKNVVDARCVRSFNGYRVTEEILRLVPNVLNFKVALRAIKLWAKQRNIYSNKLGFLGGVSWAIMVARICQVYPNATASTLVIKFFKIFSMWVWPIPIRLIEVEKCTYNLPFWDTKVNRCDRYHLMPIITPAYPQQNTSVSVSRSTFAILNEEIHRGHAICLEIEQKKAKWSELFEPTDFFKKYQHYAVLEASYTTEEKRLEWIGLVESKIRLLVSALERNEPVSLAHVHPHAFPGLRTANKKDGQSTMWLIGLVLNVKYSERCKKNLERSFKTFTNIINSLARSSNIYDEGMSLSVACLRREDLIYEPQQKALQTSETEPPRLVSPVSADKQGTTKRKLLHRSETPSKKFKDDKSLPVDQPHNVPSGGHVDGPSAFAKPAVSLTAPRQTT
ncbi:poly(A) polymerase type 3-like [Pundamilia nyererei]|uniref:Poly(A) polymerase n=1 Tax=Pundamilia nyererei TaxID=303518 RepID=A0A9Y3R0M2_9CICH|nr:PREDICTED: poly(A) polymerase type 3-like [Pundamilia nyererei]